MFTANFDDSSIKHIAQFAGFKTLLDPQVQSAMNQVGQLVITKTHDNALARFANNSPGGLAESFQIVPNSQYEITVGSDKPYGHRRDAGFDQADSLGRQYHDPPTWFFTDAINEVETSGEGMGILQDAVGTALGGL